MPEFIIKSALYPISKTLKTKTGADVLGLKIDHIFKDMKIPLYFIVGKEDEVTPVSLVKSMHDQYDFEEKYLNIVEGEHHSMRSEKTLEEICQFIKMIIQKYPLDKKEKMEKKSIKNFVMNNETGEGLIPIKIQKTRIRIRSDKEKENNKYIQNRNVQTRLEKDSDIWIFR